MLDSDVFVTDLREVFGFLKRRDDKESLRKYVEGNEAFRHLKEDAYDVIATYSGNQKLALRKENYQEKGEIDMCKALQEMEDEARAEGESKGIEDMNRLIRHLMKDGRTDDLLRSAQDAVLQKQLMEEYGIWLYRT